MFDPKKLDADQVVLSYDHEGKHHDVVFTVRSMKKFARMQAALEKIADKAGVELSVPDQIKALSNYAKRSNCLPFDRLMSNFNINSIYNLVGLVEKIERYQDGKLNSRFQTDVMPTENAVVMMDDKGRITTTENYKDGLLHDYYHGDAAVTHYHSNGKKQYVAHYFEGSLEGGPYGRTVTTYDLEGDITQSWRFKAGGANIDGPNGEPAILIFKEGRIAGGTSRTAEGGTIDLSETEADTRVRRAIEKEDPHFFSTP